jgi:DNA-binding Lrp family transcriptional regulator
MSKWKKIGNLQLVFTQITLTDHRLEAFFKFDAALRQIDEIVECHMVSGGFDYLLKFVTIGVVHYQTIIEGLLDGHIGIDKYFSYIVIKSPFTKGYYPVEKLFNQHS